MADRRPPSLEGLDHQEEGEELEAVKLANAILERAAGWMRRVRCSRLLLGLELLRVVKLKVHLHHRNKQAQLLDFLLLH